MKRRVMTVLMLSAVSGCLPFVPGPTAEAAARKLYLLVHQNGAVNRVFQYQVAANGTLTLAPGSPVDTLNTDAEGRAVATAALTPITGSPFNVGVITRSGLAFASPSLLFTTADTANLSLQTWSKQPTGALRPRGGHVTSLTSTTDVVAVDPGARILAVVSGISDKIVTQKIVSPRGAVSGLQVHTQPLGRMTAMLFIRR